MNENKTASNRWVKMWSRGMKIQRGIFYAIAIGKPFEKIFGTSLDSWLYVSRGEAVDFYAKEDELQTFSIYMKKKLMEDESFSHLIVSNYEQLYQPHLRFLSQLDKMDLAKLSNGELILLLDQYRNSLCPYGSAIWLVVTIEKEMEEVAYETFKNMKVNDIEKWASTLFSLTQPNYILEEELALLRISQLPAQKQEAALHEHTKKFEYLPLYDYDYEPYSLAYFKKRLDELNTDPNAKKHITEKEKNVKQNAKKLEQLLSTPTINEKEKLRLRMLNTLFNHKDQRSHYRSMDSYMGKKIYDELASRVKLSLSNLLFLTDEEIIEKLNNPNKQVDLEPRRKGYALIVEHGHVELLTGKSMQDYLKENVFEETKSQLTGLSVTRGFVKGVARVILHPSEISKVKQNDILVTPMTRPEYVSFMKKCSAIVTDEGGMLCHAAIVSRELNIPCVVGTKTATTLLKDGDKIEVDANKGIIHIVEKKLNEKESLALLGAWNILPLYNWQWFSDESVAHFAYLTGIKLRFFTYVKDELHFQCVFNHELNHLRTQLEQQKTEKDEINYVKRIYDDYYNQVKGLESFVQKMERKKFNTLSNSELAEIIQGYYHAWASTTIHIWYSLFLDIWYPSKNDKVAIKETASKARDQMGYLHVRCDQAADLLYAEVSKRLSIDSTLMRYLFPEEVIDSLVHGKSYVNEATDRNKFCVTINDGEYKIYSGKKAQQLFNQYNPPAIGTQSQKNLAGTPACPGEVTGIVRVIQKNNEFNTFKEGEILVALQTMIHYIPLMKKSKAILTELGGLTSHAAIVSRELNKPCIVGISNLLASLKTGDEIEVDANKGLVHVMAKPAKKPVVKGSIVKEKDPLLVDGIKWIHVVTRNQSFWHQIQSTVGHFYSSKNFGINVKLRLGNLEVHGTESNVFIEKENLNEYKEKTVELMQSRTSMEQLRRNYELYTIELENSLNECLKEFTLTNWNRFGKQYAKYGAGLFVTNIIGKEGVVQLEKRLKELGYTEKEIPKIISIITYPEKNTPLFQSQMDLMEIAKNIQQRAPSKSQLPSMLQGWWNKHGYIPVNFNEDPWTMEEVQGQLDAMLQKNCEKEIEEAMHSHHKRVQQAKEKINSINDFVISNYAFAIQEGTSLNEFRKNIFSRVSLNMRPLFEQLAKKAGMNHWRECYYFTHEELGQLLQGKKMEIQKIIKEREHIFFYIDMEGRTIFATPKQTEAIFHYVQALHGQGAKTESNITEIKGFSANSGKVRGIAKILLSSKDFHKFNPKEILVTTMTSVDFVPIMEKAAAFVTNDGGITSHAAIVAREMGKPCIIGTKNATQVIKDGDLIEVDGDNGIVRILK